MKTNTINTKLQETFKMTRGAEGRRKWGKKEEKNQIRTVGHRMKTRHTYR